MIINLIIIVNIKKIIKKIITVIVKTDMKIILIQIIM